MTRGENKCTSKGKQKQLQVSIVVIVVLYSCSCELYNVDFWGLLFDTPLVARCAPRLPASCPQDTLLWQAASRLRGSNRSCALPDHNTGLTPCAVICRPYRTLSSWSKRIHATLTGLPALDSRPSTRKLPHKRKPRIPEWNAGPVVIIGICPSVRMGLCAAYAYFICAPVAEYSASPLTIITLPFLNVLNTLDALAASAFSTSATPVGSP